MNGNRKSYEDYQTGMRREVRVWLGLWKKQGSIGRWIAMGAMVMALTVSVVGCGGDIDSKPADVSQQTEKIPVETVETAETAETVETVETVETAETEYTEESEPIDTQSQEESTADENVPKEYITALHKAESYSSAMNMSKAGIYNQLTSEYGEKFSEEAAQYAMDHIEADWNANALAKAESYSDTMHMSKAAIYDQLISEYGEMFTEEEAQYAVDNVEADWNANALEKARSYQDTMEMSPEAIRDQLTSEYGEKFTQEEADYAIQNLN